MVVACVVAAPAHGQDADTTPQSWQLRGRIKEEVAATVHAPAHLSKLRTIGWLEGKWTISEHLEARALGRAWWDGVFDLTDRYPPNVESDTETDVSLRELVLRASTSRVDLRVGRQQVVWGEALGTFVADVVNPLDLREFILPDFAEVRLPLWALHGTVYPAEGLAIEAVWTPEVRSHKLAKRGSEFEFELPRLQFPGPVALLPDRQDEWSLEQSQGGARLSWLLRGWDLAGFYFTGPDKFPVLFQRREPQPPGPPATFLEPRHPRLHVLGAALTKSLEPIVLRGEAALSIGKHYETTDPRDADGVVRRDTLDYVVSVDRTVLGVDVMLQFGQKVLFGSARGVTHGAVEGQVTSSVALRLATGFLGDTLLPAVLFAVNANRGDYRVSPRIDYAVTSALVLSLGADLFAGPVTTLYGQFHDNDRVYVELTWRFSAPTRLRRSAP